MRQVLLHAFYLLVIVLLSLTGCGSPPVPAATPTAAPPLSIPTAGTIVETPTPRPTAEELAQLRIVANRLDVMHRAAQALNDTRILADSNWRTKVDTQITILQGAKSAIDDAVLPDRYQTPRLAEILNVCMSVVTQLQSPSVQRSDVLGVEGLERCVNGLRQMAFVYAEYTK